MGQAESGKKKKKKRQLTKPVDDYQSVLSKKLSIACKEESKL